MRSKMLFLAAVMLTPPTQVLAQTNDTGEVDVSDQRDDNSKLGLLGLLGLIGLLGLKRRDPDIHVDARRERK